MDFKFDLQQFAVKITHGGASAASVSSGANVDAASGVTAWAESLSSGGFAFGGSSSSMTNEVNITGDKSWNATLASASELGALSGISNGATVGGDLDSAVITTDTAGQFNIGGQAFTVTGDTSVTFGMANSTVASIGNLDKGASLQAEAGTYIVNGESVTVSATQYIVGGESGASVLVDLDNAGGDATAEQILENLTAGNDAATIATEEASSDEKAAIENALSGESANLDGDYAVTLATASSDTSSSEQSLDFSNSTGSKNVQVNANYNLNLTFAATGNNAFSAGKGASGKVAATFTGGNNIAAIAETAAEVNISGSGNNTIKSAGTNVNLNLAGVANDRTNRTRFSTFGSGKLNLSGYDARTSGAAIGLTDSVANLFRSGAMRIINGALQFITGSGTSQINFGSSSSDIAGSANIAESSDVAESADTTTTTSGVTTRFAVGSGDGVLYGLTDSNNSVVDLSDVDEGVVMRGNVAYNNVTTHDQSSQGTLVSGSGNDTLQGGDGDVLFGGTGYNTFELSRDTTPAYGATVVMNTVTSGSGLSDDTVTSFNAGFSNTADKLVVSDLTTASLSLDSVGNLVVASGKNTLTVDTIASSSSTANVLISNAVGSDATKVAIAKSGADLSVDSSNLAGYYVGSNSNFDLSSYSNEVFVDLANNVASIESGSASVTGMTTVTGGSGTTTLYGSSANEYLVAGDGTASLWGGSGNDTLDGGSSDSRTTFGFLSGDGKTDIKNFTTYDGTNASEADVLYTNSLIYGGASVSGSDVVIRLNNDDVATIEGAAGQNIAVEYNGATVVGQAGSNSVNFDNNSQYFYTSSNDATVNVASSVSSANVWLDESAAAALGGNQDVHFYGNVSNINASGVSGDVSLAGNSNNNTIVAGSGNSSLWGGQSTGHDVLVAGSGNDMFFYGVTSMNEGNDTIRGASANDTINVFNLTLEDVNNGAATWNTVSGGMTVDFKNGGSLTLTNGTSATFQLKDGTAWAYDSSSNSFKQK